MAALPAVEDDAFGDELVPEGLDPGQDGGDGVGEV